MYLAVGCRVATTIKAHIPSDNDNTRLKKLKIDQDKLQKQIISKTSFALQNCNSCPLTRTNDSCAILWDEIEELSSTFNDINCAIKSIEEFECWDPIECRMYDI